MLKYQMALSLCVIMLTVASCQEEVLESDYLTIEHAYGEEYSGLDVEGNERSCREMTNGMCTEVFDVVNDQYALDCERDGNVAISCGCHDYICVDKEDIFDREPKEEIGLDINGDIKSCVPFEETELYEQVACTTVFTEEDQFSVDCQEAGFASVQCGCHEYICVQD